MGDHSHETMVRTDCHTFDPFFTPYISQKHPVFTKNCLPKSSPHTVQNFGNFSLKDPKSVGIWEIKVPECPLFLRLLSLKDPNFLPCMHVFERNVAPSTRSEAGKLCILETESCNLVNTFRCKFNQGDKNKISGFTGLTDPIVHYGWTSLVGRADTQAIIPLVIKHGRG